MVLLGAPWVGPRRGSVQWDRAARIDTVRHRVEGTFKEIQPFRAVAWRFREHDANGLAPVTLAGIRNGMGLMRLQPSPSDKRRTQRQPQRASPTTRTIRPDCRCYRRLAGRFPSLSMASDADDEPSAQPSRRSGRQVNGACHTSGADGRTPTRRFWFRPCVECAVQGNAMPDPHPGGDDVGGHCARARRSTWKWRTRRMATLGGRHPTFRSPGGARWHPTGARGRRCRLQQPGGRRGRRRWRAALRCGSAVSATSVHA